MGRSFHSPFQHIELNAMDIHVEVEDLSPVRKKLKIQIPQAETQRAYEEISKKIASLARIPGFRPGKAPMGLIRNRFKSEIKDELIQDLLPRSYDEAVKSRELKPLALPRIEKLDFEVGQPLQYEAVFEVAPDFQADNYVGLKLEKKVLPVTDEDVDKVINQLMENAAKFVPVTDRTARSGDQLTVDIEGTYINKDSGEPTAEEPLKESSVLLILNDEQTLPEFTDSLSGAARDETREFVVTYPADFARKEFAGKSMRYRVTVRAIKEKKLPAPGDEFAKELGQEYETMDQVRKQIGEDLATRRKLEVENSLREQAISQLLEQHRFEVPEVLVEGRVQHKLQHFAHDLARQGVDVARSGVNWQKVRDKLRESSEREVRAALILEHIAKTENL
ncbi:MAG TPA: trigger factor, partial [Acidobacteriota bacterium]|nr:trigger factor [Acidobacteriota bacterium]